MRTCANVLNGRPQIAAATFESRNPATGEVLGVVPLSTHEQVDAAVAAARAAQPAWAALPDEERRALLMQVAIWQIIPALRTANTVVIKPSEYTSIGTLEMVRLINEVLPPGVLNTVTGAGEVGAWLVDHPGIDKITFTGSTATGKRIAATAAARLVPTTMELGGNDAAIVLPDADPAAITMGLFWGAFINMGQTCAAAKRLYVHESIHDAVVAQLEGLARAMPMGNGMDPGCVVGPIQNRMQFDKVNRLVDSARSGGATIVCGGRAAEGPGHFYPLTLVTGVRDGDPIVDEEQFGPVLPIIKYRDVDDAVASANRLDVGLGASVWSSDETRAR